ncbi:MAG TPA: TonB-dependent receptor, partial [Rhodocyclaceae bacterium]|nr:TonB-dependent receptor [Rhodocyclaceae bacterium]
NLFARHAVTDGWRENSQSEQNAVSGRVGVYVGKGEMFVDYAAYHDQNGLPSYVREADFLARPRYSRTPLDNQRRDGYRLRPGLSLPLGKALMLEAEASFEHEKFHSNYVSFSSIGERTRDTWSLTPRLRWQHGLGSLASETVIGIDRYTGDIDASYSTAPAQSARQESTAYYLQNQTDFTRNWTLTVGARSQRMRQTVEQAAYPAWFTAALKDGKTRSQSAWDVGLSYRGEGWRGYGKVGSTYRFANTDELFSYDPFTGNPICAGNLKPQRGKVLELGGSGHLGPVHARASLYRMTLQDEIGYDAATFANVNLADTRRQGLETEADWRITTDLSAKLAYTYTDARFRDGINAGKRLTLVARHKGTATLAWNGGALGTYSALVNYVGERPYSGDVGNIRKSLASYTTLDLQAQWNVKPLVVSLRVLNALDKRYAPFAGYSTSINDYYYYPADGRSVFLSARYDFK